MNTEQDLLEIYNKATKLYEIGIVKKEDLDKIWNLYERCSLRNSTINRILEKPLSLTEEEFQAGAKELKSELESNGLDLSKFEREDK